MECELIKQDLATVWEAILALMDGEGPDVEMVSTGSNIPYYTIL